MERNGGKRKLAGYYCLVLLTALSLSACGGGGGGASTPSATAVGADAVKLYDFIAKQTPYTNWSLWPGTSKFSSGNAPHGALVTTYVNDIAASSIQAQNGMADGSIIVKENYMADKTLAGLTVMYKIKGYNAAAGDWYWVNYKPDGTSMASGQVQMCIDCHTQAKTNDYLFTGKVVTTTPTPTPAPTVSLATDIQPIFNANCIGCHSATGVAGFLSLASGAAYGNLVNKPATKTSGTLVIPGNSANSVLYQRISNVGLPAGAAQMPIGSVLSAANQNLVKTWIDQGANNN